MEQRSPIVSYKRSRERRSEGRGEGRGEEVRSKEKKRGERVKENRTRGLCLCAGGWKRGGCRYTAVSVQTCRVKWGKSS